ncbi:MAG: polyprenyl synthetase family protein [Bacteroidales bacterium]|nr:polyprenyl synthetase family protein [Bacteroidales bacterium]MBN2756380.1 polyprenyl synthetase family protein [Bacteroidales bacterium]
MSSLKEIKKPIAKEMIEFEKFFKNSMKSKVPLLDIVTNYIIRRKGKQLRPVFVFLSAKLHGEITKSTYNAASLVELMHTATLVHDDVVDESYQRRGFFSINALWKNKIAVLVGDYLLSRGLLLAVDNQEFDVLKIISDAVKEMAEGELMQIEKARKLNTDEDVYFEIIRKKTATLLASCTASGAKSAGVSDEIVEKMRDFGENIGIAFQIKDDLFDYQKNNLTGKPSGNDIQEKKITLPLLYSLNNSNNGEHKKIINLIKKHNKNPKRIKEIIDFVNEKGGIEYAEKKMNEYKEKSLKILAEFTDNEAKTALIELVNFTIERNK